MNKQYLLEFHKDFMKIISNQVCYVLYQYACFFNEYKNIKNC